VRDLLADLRELARGIYPVALADEGLAAALEALAEEPGAGLRLSGPLPEERLEPQVEAAAYLLARSAAMQSDATVAVARENGRLLVDVASGGEPAELVHLEDRVGAVGGTLTTERSPGGETRMRAVLPCA
jgi:signal transduction histidine kinase